MKSKSKRTPWPATVYHHRYGRGKVVEWGTLPATVLVLFDGYMGVKAIRMAQLEAG